FGEELFFFEGSGRNGAKLVAMPSGFERYDEVLWTWLGSNFFEVGEEQASDAGTTQERIPYPGLSPFTQADAELFFGREREVESFLNRLRVQPLLAVVGPSGA